MTAMHPLPGTSVQAIVIPVAHRAHPGHSHGPFAAMSAAVATISNRMRLNFFAHRDIPEPSQPPTPPPPGTSPGAAPGPTAPAKPAKTYPADLIVWGIVVRAGFDEMDDPWYHRGITQHAYLEGHDDAALCGFRPPVTGTRGRRRPRLGLPSAADHPMCGICARMVVRRGPACPCPSSPTDQRSPCRWHPAWLPRSRHPSAWHLARPRRRAPRPAPVAPTAAPSGPPMPPPCRHGCVAMPVVARPRRRRRHCPSAMTAACWLGAFTSTTPRTDASD